MANHVCYDRYLPDELLAPSPGVILDPGLDVLAQRAVFLLGKMWPSGSTIRCAFLGGTSTQQAYVKTIAARWLKHANLKFEWGSIPGSHVRVSFTDDGAWSYVGTDCRSIPANEPTLNLGWLDDGVVLHEFGHMLGLVHEHQNPRGNPLVWDEAAVIRELQGPPNYWTEEQIRHNVLERYSTTQTNGSAFDPASIMLYAFPKEWTKNGVATQENDAISPTDAEWMRRTYPGAPVPPTVLELLVLPAPTLGEIGKPGEEDRYSFTVQQAGTYTVQTMGPSDLLLSLLGPDGAVMATDDDGGEDRNARVTLTLQPGTYTVAVRHYSASAGVGRYAVLVQRG